MSAARSPRAARSRDGIPDATVARLPIYLRALLAYSERGTATVSSEELAAAAGRQLGQAAQGPVLPGLVRHPRGRLRRRLPRLPDLPRARPDPGLGLRDRRGRFARARARELRRLLLPRLPHRGPDRRRPGPGRRDPGRRRGQPAGRAGVDHRRARGDHRRHRHPRRRRPGGLRPPGGGRRDQHPQLRPGGALGAGRGGRAQGRPVGRAADPGLPRPAQVAARRRAAAGREPAPPLGLRGCGGGAAPAWPVGRCRDEHPRHRSVAPHRLRSACWSGRRCPATA